MSARRWEVSYGYYCDVVAYTGPSTFLAGLHFARANRDHNHRTSTTQVVDLDSIDVRDTDEDGSPILGDSQTDDEQEWFEQCYDAGVKAKRRRAAGRAA